MPLVVNCAGCERPINDQYLYNVLDQAWHQSCIQCSDCKSSLNDKCFSRDGKLYCKNDFFRRYGPKCAGCNHGISPSDLVRRARDKVYHLNCFSCYICRKPIGTGEQLFFIDEYKFMCKQDYALNKSLVQDELDEDQCLLKSPINNSQLNLYDSSTSSVSSTGSEQRNLKFLQNHSMHQMHPLDSISSSSSSSPSLLKQDLNQSENSNFHPSNTSTPPLGKPNNTSQLYLDHAAEKENLLINTSNDSNTDYLHMTNNFHHHHHHNHLNHHPIHNSQNFYPDFMDSDKDEVNNSDDELIDEDDEDVDDDEEDEDGNGDRTHGSNGKSSSSSKDDNNLNGKKRGPRTTIKAKQLEMLKNAFSATPKPTRHIREQLAQETGLNMRVIQVWFQNRRSKERRMKQLSVMGNRRQYYRNSAAAAAAAARLQQNQQNLPAQNLTIPMTSNLAPTPTQQSQQQQRPYDLEQTEFSNQNQANYMNHTTDFYGNNNNYEFMVQNNENIIPRPYESVINPVMENWNMI